MSPTHFLIYTSKPLVCLFPALFKQNLLTFIYLVYQHLPETTVRSLISCLNQDPHPSPWVSTLVRQLERNMGADTKEPLFTPLCSQRLKNMSHHLVGFDDAGGWAKYFSGHLGEAERFSDLPERGAQRKRKGSVVSLGSDEEETGQQSKRTKTDVCGSEHLDAAEQSIKEEISRLQSNVPVETPDEVKPASENPSEDLPDHIKVEADQYFYHIGSCLNGKIWFYVCLGVCSSNKRITGK